MYHEVTYAEIKRSKRRRIVVLVAILIAAVFAWFAYGRAKDLAREQGAVALRESILQAAMQCAAVEGSYPPSITHLEEHYGLVINGEDYQVAYEWLGDNILPSVVVSVR